MYKYFEMPICDFCCEGDTAEDGNILYLLGVSNNFNYIIVTTFRGSLKCLNDYPFGLGSLKPNPSACLTAFWERKVSIVRKRW